MNAGSSASASPSFAFTPPLGLRLAHEAGQAVRRRLDLVVDLRHFFVGGSSPVATRQMRAES